jgi:hypothetical protein
MSEYVYNPLDKVNLGKSVAQALLEREAVGLKGLAPFDGAGVYAVYYRGPFAAYERMASLNRGVDPKAPIYVGKAVPQGARKGSKTSSGLHSQALFRRLQDHAKSVASAENLELADFFCRYLAVDDIWIPLGESLLITTFAPLWNLLLDGFGNHDPGSGRHAGLAPRWDVLHPGRSWALKCKPRAETAAQIEREVSIFLELSPPLARLHQVAVSEREHEAMARPPAFARSIRTSKKTPRA